MSGPARNVRRRLERQADAIARKIRGRVLSLSPGDLLVVGADAEPIVIPATARALALATMGMGDVEPEIAAALDARPPFTVPVLTILEGWGQIGFTASRPLARGGVA